MTSLRYAKLGAVLALALGTAIPAALIATPASADGYHEQDRGFHRDHQRDQRDGFRGDFRGGDSHFRGNGRGDGRGFEHGRWEHHHAHRFWFGR